MPRGWKKISEEEMTAIFGKGYPNEIQDSDDQHPCKCPPGPCPPGSGPDSYPKCYACRDFFGMPAWRISEPYITLWVEDEPLGYQPARGDRVAFQIFYKQRDDVVRSTNWFSVGTLWNSSWLSYVEQSETNTAVMYVPGGGKRRYTVDGTTLQIDSNTRMERLTNGGGALTGYRVLYRDGSLDVYDFVVTGATWTNAFLTAQVNRVGQTNRFQYTNYVNGVVRLLRVIDAQNQTNLIYYATNHAYSSNLIARVVDPFGRQTTLEYDSLGHVTNVVDVGGLTNVFKYDSAGWMTNLITPYGTNVFELSGNTNYWGTNAPDGEINRYARITEPNGTSKHLYVYRDLSSWLPSILWEDGPIDLPELTTSLWDFSYPLYRNSFYWNHRQYAAISEDGKADFSQMLNSDYGLARLRHWQHKHVAEGANSSVGPTLAVEIEGYPTHPTTSPKTSEF
jgi:YD repeat-containing protein